MKRLFVILSVLLLVNLALFAGGGTEKTETTREKAQNKITNNSTVASAEKYYLFENSDPKPCFDYSEIPFNAIGYKYKGKDNQWQYQYFTKEGGIWGNAIDSIADTFDDICMQLCLAIHPFPSILFKVYDTSSFDSMNDYRMSAVGSEAEIDKFNSNFLLISNNFYDASDLKSDKDTKNSRWELAIGEDYEATGTGMLQYQKWSLITVLFLTMFIAEILFTAIYGYITWSGQENLLKEIAKKAGITFALFVLASALPFLVESMRYGFVQIANIFYANSAISIEENFGLDDSAREILNTTGNVYNIPGIFLRLIKPFFVQTDSSETNDALIDGANISDSTSVAGIIARVLANIIIFIFRILMFMMCLKASLHILMNVIEVYLLLGLAMILTPFAVFTPLKSVGAKCVMSLMTNIIECFIILAIIYTAVPASIALCVQVINKSSIYSADDLVTSFIQYEVTGYLGGQSFFTRTNLTDGLTTQTLTISGNNKFIVLTIPVLGYDLYSNVDTTSVSSESMFALVFKIKDYKKTDLTDYLQAFSVTHYVELSKDELKTTTVSVKKDTSVFELTYYDAFSDDKVKQVLQNNYIVTSNANKNWNNKSDQWENINSESFIEIAITFYQSLVNAFNEEKSLSTNNNIKEFIKYLMDIYQMSDMKEAIQNYFKELNLYSEYIQDTGYTNSSTYNITGYYSPEIFDEIGNPNSIGKKEQTMSVWLKFLIIAMGIYIPCYLIQQSTAITNSLMNGSAAMESFANSLNQIGSNMKKAAGMVAKAGGTVMKGGIDAVTAIQTKGAQGGNTAAGQIAGIITRLKNASTPQDDVNNKS